MNNGRYHGETHIVSFGVTLRFDELANRKRRPEWPEEEASAPTPPRPVVAQATVEAEPDARDATEAPAATPRRARRRHERKSMSFAPERVTRHKAAQEARQEASRAPFALSCRRARAAALSAARSGCSRTPPIVAIAGVSIFLWPHLYLGDHGSRPADLGLVDGLCAWDCREYAALAADGYTQVHLTNFWPMLPWYARPLVWLHLSPYTAVVVVANLASLVAYVAIYRVFEILDGEEAARWGLALFAAYPFAFFFGVGYTEPLMVAASAGGMWLALSGPSRLGQRRVRRRRDVARAGDARLARARGGAAARSHALAHARGAAHSRRGDAAVAAVQLGALRRSAGVDARAQAVGLARQPQLFPA